MPPAPPASSPTVPEDQARLWYALPELLDDAALRQSCEAVLSLEETLRYGQLKLDKVRRQYLLSRALVRAALSRCAAVEPRAWRFVRDAGGRPEIDLRPGLPPLRFSLSHTDGLVGVVVTAQREVGFDAENIGRAPVDSRVIERALSPAELASLHLCAPDRRAYRFLELWTLKEAYLKARSLGLDASMRRFSFELPEGLPPRVTFPPGFEDAAETWQFAQPHLTPHFLAAVAIRRGRGPDLEILVEEMTRASFLDLGRQSP